MAGARLLLLEVCSAHAEVILQPASRQRRYYRLLRTRGGDPNCANWVGKVVWSAPHTRR